MQYERLLLLYELNNSIVLISKLSFISYYCNREIGNVVAWSHSLKVMEKKVTFLSRKKQNPKQRTNAEGLL